MTYIVLWAFILRGIIQKPTLWSYFHKKNKILTLDFEDTSQEREGGTHFKMFTFLVIKINIPNKAH
jgi:hypothetical protein